ncbi:transporter [Nonlabens xiamenensis]|uniref:transporter n=1 Tax=Nonlabens xiamenensis TaxID=2341043 RepID=UPI000F608D8D|nr:transporter [Nonlabens xiamenensis]
MKKHVLFTLILLTSMILCAQNESTDIGPLVTDRPDATESPSLVRKGFLQIETGGFYTESGDDDFKVKETTYNTTLLRYGLLDNMELRIGLDYRSTAFEADGNEIGEDLNGTSPLLLGAKIGIADGDGWSPKIALLGHLTMPFSASSDYKPEQTGMDFRFSFDHTINDKSGIAYNIGARLGPDNPELAYLYTLAYGYDLTKTIGFYVELYGDFPEDSSANHLWDAGFTYLATDDLQFDLTFGSGITEGQNLLLSAGLSYRIRKN